MANITSAKTVVGNSIAINSGDIKVRIMTVRAIDIANAGAYATDDTATFQIPVKAGEVVVDVGAKLIEAFDGSGDQLNMIAGALADPNGFLVTAALHASQTEITAIVRNTGAFFNDATTDDVINGKQFDADDTIDFVFDGSAGASIDLNDLTSGEVLLKVFYIDYN